MRVLVVAATELEIPRLAGGVDGARDVDVLITGVGMVATAARVARALSQTRYDVAFNFGICGSFDSALAPGDVVHIVSDCISELGAEDGDRFVTMEEIGFTGASVLENGSPPDNQALNPLPRVRAITVNTVHGREDSIAAIAQRLGPQVESMEGAAFAYACTISGVWYAQVRAVSNVVERRNRSAWKIDLAVRNLNRTALDILRHV
jgi:futalosine hydrolase